MAVSRHPRSPNQTLKQTSRPVRVFYLTLGKIYVKVFEHDTQLICSKEDLRNTQKVAPPPLKSTISPDDFEPAS